MRVSSFHPSPEGEARLLLLIEGFSRGSKALEGRTKLAKLDFLLRYPEYLERALKIRRPHLAPPSRVSEADVESRMVRYRYGPWDPSYFALLGRLMGKGLVRPVPFSRGIGYRTTEKGRTIASALRAEESWHEVAQRVDILRQHFDLAGTTLKNFIYDHFPDVTHARWGRSL